MTVDTDPDCTRGEHRDGETGVFMMLRVKISSYLSEYAAGSRVSINLSTTQNIFILSHTFELLTKFQSTKTRESDKTYYCPLLIQ